MLSGALRVSSAYDSADRPLPTSTATTTSRRRRQRERAAVPGLSSGIRLGSQRRPSRNSTSVTTSTASWVRARSGAENQAKVMHSTSPTTPSMVSAARRWNLACQAAPTAQKAPMTHSSTNSGVAGTRSRSPQVSGTISADASAASPVTSTSTSNCGCSRRVPARRSRRRAARLSRAMPRSNRRLPSSRCSPGAPAPRRCLKRRAAAGRRRCRRRWPPGSSAAAC